MLIHRCLDPRGDRSPARPSVPVPSGITPGLPWRLVVVLPFLLGPSPAAGQVSPGANVKPVCVMAATDEASAWKGPVARKIGKEGTWFLELNRDRNVFHAVRELDGDAALWVGFPWLRLDVEGDFQGTLNVTIRESDGGNLEPWIAVRELQRGRQSAWIRLLPRPEGDLILGGPQWDRAWNPDTPDRLTLTLTSGIGRLRLFAAELVRDREAVEREESAPPTAPAGHQ